MTARKPDWDNEEIFYLSIGKDDFVFVPYEEEQCINIFRQLKEEEIVIIDGEETGDLDLVDTIDFKSRDDLELAIYAMKILGSALVRNEELKDALDKEKCPLCGRE